MLTLVPRAALTLLALLVLAAAPSGAQAAAKKKTATCKAGQVPKAGKKTVVCVKLTLPKGAKPAGPAKAPQGQLAQITDQLQTALELSPKARARLEKKIGKKRAGKLVDLALEGWQKKAGIAAATETKTQSFGSAGAGGTAKLEIGGYDDGRTGVHVGAEVSVDVTSKGLKDLGAGEDMSAGIDGGKATVKLTFDDILSACPSAAGAVPGRLEASGSLSVDVATKSG
jgi:hypothetical protein